MKSDSSLLFGKGVEKGGSCANAEPPRRERAVENSVANSISQSYTKAGRQCHDIVILA